MIYVASKQHEMHMKMEDIATGLNGGKEKTCKCHQKDGSDTNTGLRVFTLVFIHDVNNFMHFLLQLVVYLNWVCCVSIIFSVLILILALLTSRISRVKCFCYLQIISYI